MSDVLRMFVISSNVQKLYRVLPFKQKLLITVLACFDDKQQINISNKVSLITFISAYVLMTFGKIHLR